jgi:hypothetical protein
MLDVCNGRSMGMQMKAVGRGGKKDPISRYGDALEQLPGVIPVA